MKKNISESNAILGQGIILFFFIPFNILVWHIALRLNFSVAILVFSIVTTVLSTLVIFLSFKTADVSIKNDTLIIETLFKTKRINKKNYKNIGALLWFGYYLDFKEEKRVYVLFGPDEIIKQFGSSDPKGIINDIESKIHQELDVSS